jgi:hypothetical protein
MGRSNRLLSFDTTPHGKQKIRETQREQGDLIYLLPKRREGGYTDGYTEGQTDSTVIS